MSESIDSTQPTKAQKPTNGSELAETQEEIVETQPVTTSKPAQEQESQPEQTQVMEQEPKQKKPRRFGRFLLNVLIFLVIIGLAVFAGYGSGIGLRQQNQEELNVQQLGDQYARALVDIEFGRYDAAKQRLEYIIQIDPSFPGAQQKLTEVLVLTSIPTETPVASPTPTLVVDTSDLDGLFAQAQQMITSQQWQNALTILDMLRKEDATFKAGQVDGMYYFALRNLGVDMIKEGNLEGGIYELTLAERFGPLDNTAVVLRDNARFYLNAASFWDLDWKVASESFAQLNGSGMWDGTMTATERYRIATMRYGDQLYNEGRYCAAYEQYQKSGALGNLDEQSVKYMNQSYQECYPPTEIPTATPTIVPSTEAPPAVPAETTAPPATESPAP